MSDRVDAEPKYTLDQAQAELFRRDCADHGHHPEVFNYGGYEATCLCGEVTWRGTPRSETT